MTHGTGTRLGDPVEINALVEAFGSGSGRSGFCALTSTKPNIGHTQAASGLVSVIALVQAMRHGVIPPSINCDEPSDYVDWERSPFFVNREARPWLAEGGSRRGGVSAFGFSGTNAHVIVESYDAGGVSAEEVSEPAYVLPVSAKSEGALGRALTELAGHLERVEGVSLASVSHALMSGRHHFAYRCALVVRDAADAVRLLREAAAGERPLMVRSGVVPRDF
ncbi:CurL C-terminal domain-containing protein, partial [Streptomyces mutabilis]|uniref:CurL C-terminal domain-containing protein n=1 Tax=Streptomyces mutabilis TaxID=67332 RepID=UPI002E1DCA06